MLSKNVLAQNAKDIAMIKTKYIISILLAVLVIAGGAIFIYSEHYAPLNTEGGADIRVWYVNDSQAWSRVEELVERFNSGEGAEHGVSAQPYAFDSADDMRSALGRIKERGLSMPNVVLCDADLAAALREEGLLADVRSYFGEWEETWYDENAVEASSINGKLITVPVAASINIAVANRQCAEDGTLDCASFEELCRKATEYYDKEGARLFSISDYAEFFRLAMAQLGESFDAVSPHSTDNDDCKYIYKLIAETAYDRGVSSAADDPVSVLADGELPLAFMPSEMFVRYCTNDFAENVVVLPEYPKLTDGDSVYTMKVYGMTILSADENEENASAMFIKWFTSPEINTELCAGSGLIPCSGSIEYDDDSASCAMLDDYYSQLVKKSEFAASEPSAEFADNVSEFNIIMRSVMDSMD